MSDILDIYNERKHWIPKQEQREDENIRKKNNALKIKRLWIKNTASPLINFIKLILCKCALNFVVIKARYDLQSY